MVGLSFPLVEKQKVVIPFESPGIAGISGQGGEFKTPGRNMGGPNRNRDSRNGDGGDTEMGGKVFRPGLKGRGTKMKRPLETWTSLPPFVKQDEKQNG